MDPNEFKQKIKAHTRPVVVDFWAPWCGPCRVTKPVLEKLAKEFDGKVDFWAVNADDNSEVLQSLGISGIPTLVIFNNNSSDEVGRVVGARPESLYRQMFTDLAEGRMPSIAGLSTFDRLMRIGLAVIVAGVGLGAQPINWLLVAIAVVLAGMAFIDKLPLGKRGK